MSEGSRGRRVRRGRRPLLSAIMLRVEFLILLAEVRYSASRPPRLHGRQVRERGGRPKRRRTSSVGWTSSSIQCMRSKDGSGYVTIGDGAHGRTGAKCALNRTGDGVLVANEQFHGVEHRRRAYLPSGSQAFALKGHSARQVMCDALTVKGRAAYELEAPLQARGKLRAVERQQDDGAVRRHRRTARGRALKKLKKLTSRIVSKSIKALMREGVPTSS